MNQGYNCHMNIVLPDKINISEKYKDDIRHLGAQVFDDLPDVEELKERIRDAEVITACYVDITPEIIDAAPKLKYIIVPAVGYEWVDTDYAASKGITTLNCPTFNSQAVAEHAITLLMTVNRNIVTAANELRSAKWSPQALIGHEVACKSMGLIGYGNVGTRIEKIAVALGMNVSYVNSSSTDEEIDTLVAQSDFLVICAPLNDKTKKLMDKRRLDLLKASAVLVNVGRGAIIDQPYLFELLKNGKLRGAGLDVFTDEPLAGVPNNDIVALASLPNVVATPHIAYNTEEIQDRQGKEIVANIESCIAAKPVNVVRLPA